MLKPERQHEYPGADERQGYRHNRDEDRADRPKEQEDHHNNDRYRFAKRPNHVIDRCLDELAGVVGHVHLERRRKRVPDAFEFFANAGCNSQGIAARRGLNANKDRVLAIHGNGSVETLRVKRQRRDIAEPGSPPSLTFTTISRKASTLCRSVLAVMLAMVKYPFCWPGAVWKLLARIAAATSAALTPRAAMRTGSSQTRIAKVCPPITSAEATPATVARMGCTTRFR